MNGAGVKTCVWGGIHAFKQMRVCPLTRRNIWNINIYKKNIYKKQIDNKHHKATTDRNTLEHSGTTFQWLFQKRSTVAIYRNTSRTPVVQGLQRFSRKSCSVMFWLDVPSRHHAESPVIRGLPRINF
jgi:hypothetical protein